MHDRKNPPTEVLFASVEQSGREIWTLSKGRRHDTFVGVTQVSTGKCFLYPSFTQDPADKHFGISRLHDEATDTPARVELAAARAHYPRNTVIVVPPDAGADGIAHATACALAGIAQTDAIGWSIQGNANAGRTFLVRFSSGLNNRNRTIAPRQPKPPDDAKGRAVAETQQAFEARMEASKKESRDLPKAWRLAILDALAADLGMTVQEADKRVLGPNDKSVAFSTVRAITPD